MVTSGVNEETRSRGSLRPGSGALLVLWTAIGAGALLLLLKSVQNSAEFGRLQPAVLILNVVGLIALVTLLTRKLWQLIREYRRADSEARAGVSRRERSLCRPRREER